MRLKKAVKRAIRGVVRSNANPALVGNFSTFTLIVAFMPESVATTVVCAYGVGNRLLDGLEGPDRRYLSQLGQNEYALRRLSAECEVSS
jgi:hypothetical protein